MAWVLVATLIGAFVVIGGYVRFIASTQKKDVAGVGGTAALLNKVAHQRTGLPPVTPPPPPGLRGYRSTVSTACRKLRHEVASIPPATSERVRLQHVSQSMDSFVSTLVSVPAPPGQRIAAESLLSSAKLYRLHVQLALQAVVRGDARGERTNLSAAKQDLQDFGAARAELGVSC